MDSVKHMGMVEHIRKRLGMYWLTHDGIPDASVWIFLRTIRFTRQIEPSCLIYITDGYGPAPDNPPPYPVLWILTGDGEKSAPWGALRLRA